MVAKTEGSKLTEGEKQNYCHCHPIPGKEHLQGKAGMVVLAEYFTHSGLAVVL